MDNNKWGPMGTSISSPLHLPRTLFGRGAITALTPTLDVLGIRRALLVTDPGVARAGGVGRVLAAIDKPVSVVVFDGVTENPVFADADSGAGVYTLEQCDGVIALGGGSVIDTAKYVALLATHTGTVADYAGVPNATVSLTAPLIAIPTTAGTGTEANATAGIHPTSTSTAVGVDSPYLLPRVAILDPELTLSLPPRLTAATGIDAISHCIEGYLSRNHNPFAESLALDGISRAIRYIRRAVSAGNDISARSEMMIAAYAGGAAISMGLGPAHAIAITCGDQGFHHGVLSGVGLVAALDEMAAKQPERAAALAVALGVGPTESLAKSIASLMGELGLPSTLREMGYSSSNIEALAAAAHGSFFNLSAWHHPSASEYAAMIAGSLR